MTNNDQLLEQIRKVVREENEPIKKDVQGIKQAQGHTNTALEAVKAGQDDLRGEVKIIRETMATKADVMRVGVKVDKIKNRIEDLEDNAGIPHPDKN